MTTGIYLLSGPESTKNVPVPICLLWDLHPWALPTGSGAAFELKPSAALLVSQNFIFLSILIVTTSDSFIPFYFTAERIT